MVRSRLAEVWATALVVLAMVAACSGSGDPAPSTSQAAVPAVDEPVAGPAHGEQLEATRTEFLELMAQCMRDKGIAASAADGAVEFDSADEADVNVLLDAWRGCESGLAAQGRIEPPSQPTAEYFSGLYDYYITLAECLERQGYSIPDPPSKDSFVEANGFLGSFEDAWFPYKYVELETIGPERADQLMQECPPDYRTN